MSKLLVGFGRADITPQKSVPLTGYGNDATRISDEILDPLYATCLAFTDGEGSTALVLAVDLLYALPWMCQVVGEAVGLPAERVNVSANHTHSAPSIRLRGAVVPECQDYVDHVLTKGLIEAARQAMDDRKSADMYITDLQTKGMTFVRNYLLSDGAYGSKYSAKGRKLLAHEAEPDNQLQLIRFRREGGKDVLIANFQSHGTMTGTSKSTRVSADWSGAMRAKVEQDSGYLFAYFNGACGDMTPVSFLEWEKSFENAEYIQHGQTMADYILAADGWQQVAAGRVLAKRQRLDVKVDHSLDHLKDIAKPICEEWFVHGNLAQANAMSEAAGLHSVYHAESVLDKLALGETLDLALSVVSVGDVAFAMAPYEMYTCNGMHLKAASPYKMTVVGTCANDYRSYLPSAAACLHGGYTVDRCRFVPGTAERMVDEFLILLHQMKEA